IELRTLLGSQPVLVECADDRAKIGGCRLRPQYDRTGSATLFDLAVQQLQRVIVGKLLARYINRCYSSGELATLHLLQDQADQAADGIRMRRRERWRSIEKALV